MEGFQDEVTQEIDILKGCISKVDDKHKAIDEKVSHLSTELMSLEGVIGRIQEHIPPPGAGQEDPVPNLESVKSLLLEVVRLRSLCETVKGQLDAIPLQIEESVATCVNTALAGVCSLEPRTETVSRQLEPSVSTLASTY